MNEQTPMLQVFQGWRRKVGCVMLVLALALTFGWIRSELLTDQLNIGKVLLESTGGALHLSMHEDSDDMGLIWDTLARKSYHGSTQGVFSGETFWRPVWCYRLLGIEIGSVKDPHGLLATAYFAQCPYQWIVLPLTLISAYLILWKPRKRGSRANG